MCSGLTRRFRSAWGAIGRERFVLAYCGMMLVTGHLDKEAAVNNCDLAYLGRELLSLSNYLSC